jgi:hypothetical protein
MGPLTSPYVPSRVDSNTSQPYARVDLNPMPELALSPSQGLWIWPQYILYCNNELLLLAESNLSYLEFSS